MNDDLNQHENSPVHTHRESEGEPSSRATAVQPSGHASTTERQKLQQDRVLRFLHDLIRNLDILVYCQLSILYYMDCSTYRFGLRALPHWFYFTPKPAFVPPVPLSQRPYSGTVFATNAICLLWHLFAGPSVAGEATRGYMHGGLVIDFVGQLSPVGKWRLCISDVLCFALQIMLMAATLEKHELLGRSNRPVKETSNQQTHDAEEAGLLSADPSSTGDFEMDILLPRTTIVHEGSVANHERPYDGSSNEDLSQYAGEVNIATLHLLDMARSQWHPRNISRSAVVASG